MPITSSLQLRGVGQAHLFCRYKLWRLRSCLQKDLAAGWNTYKDPQISHSSHYKKIMSFLLAASLHTWKIPKSLCWKLQVALSLYGNCPWSYCGKLHFRYLHTKSQKSVCRRFSGHFIAHTQTRRPFWSFWRSFVSIAFNCSLSYCFQTM